MAVLYSLQNALLFKVIMIMCMRCLMRGGILKKRRWDLRLCRYSFSPSDECECNVPWIFYSKIYAFFMEGSQESYTMFLLCIMVAKYGKSNNCSSTMSGARGR